MKNNEDKDFKGYRPRVSHILITLFAGAVISFSFEFALEIKVKSDLKSQFSTKTAENK